MSKRTILLSIGLGLALLSITRVFANPENPSSTNAQRRSLVGTLINQDLLRGCGCNFYFPSDPHKRSVFGSNMDEEYAWMNIDSVDVKLSLRRGAGMLRSSGKQASILTSETYQTRGIKLSVSYVVTKDCEPNDEDCEATSYDATCTVTKGKRKETIKLQGVCGCY